MSDTLVSPRAGKSYPGIAAAEGLPGPGRTGGGRGGVTTERVAAGWRRSTGGISPTSRRPRSPGRSGRCRPVTSSAASASSGRRPRLRRQAGRLRALLRAAPFRCHPCHPRRPASSVRAAPREVLDVGCGTGTCRRGLGAARRQRGDPRHRSASVGGGRSELDLPATRVSGRASSATPAAAPLRASPDTAAIVAYAANEIGDDGRDGPARELVAAQGRGAAVLVIEPIARRAMPWWPRWESRVVNAGGRADEWRFPFTLPPRQQSLAHAAGLDPRELTARSLYLPGAGS